MLVLDLLERQELPEQQLDFQDYLVEKELPVMLHVYLEILITEYLDQKKNEQNITIIVVEMVQTLLKIVKPVRLLLLVLVHQQDGEDQIGLLLLL
jgi:hypothetical protein